MEHEIQKQKAKATMLFDDVLTMKKSQRLQMHFKKNHSRRAQQASPEPLPILPPFQSPSPPPPPIPILGTPENPIDIDEGLGNLLSRYRMTPNQLLPEMMGAMRSSPSGDGQALQLSMTGKGGSTGTPQGDAEIVDW